MDDVGDSLSLFLCYMDFFLHHFNDDMINMIYIYTNGTSNGTKDKDFGSKGTIQELCNDKALRKIKLQNDLVKSMTQFRYIQETI